LWLKAKNNPLLAVYFPDFSESKFPQRKYMLNVANTVSPNSVINAVSDIKKKRNNEGVDVKPLELTGELAQAFLEFTSIIPTNKKLKKGKSLRFTDDNNNFD